MAIMTRIIDNHSFKLNWQIAETKRRPIQTTRAPSNNGKFYLQENHMEPEGDLSTTKMEDDMPKFSKITFTDRSKKVIEDHFH